MLVLTRSSVLQKSERNMVGALSPEAQRIGPNYALLMVRKVITSYGLVWLL